MVELPDHDILQRVCQHLSPFVSPCKLDLISRSLYFCCRFLNNSVHWPWRTQQVVLNILFNELSRPEKVDNAIINQKSQICQLWDVSVCFYHGNIDTLLPMLFWVEPSFNNTSNQPGKGLWASRIARILTLTQDSYLSPKSQFIDLWAFNFIPKVHVRYFSSPPAYFIKRLNYLTSAVKTSAWLI